MPKDNLIFENDTFKLCLTVAEGDDGMARMLRLLIDQGGRIALTDDDGSVNFIELSPKAKALLAKADPLRRLSGRPRRGTIMSKNKVTLDACRAVTGYDESACLLHALLTTNWPGHRLVICNGPVWVDVSDHPWLAYAETQGHNAMCRMFMDDILVQLDEDDNDWSVLRPTQECLAALGLNEGWYRQ
jgi:hypothetical protein